MQSGLVFASYIFLLSFIGDIFNVQNYFFTLIISCALLAWSLVAKLVKNLPAVGETWVQSLGWEDPLEKGMATHSRILTCRIPWTEKCGWLQSLGSQRVRHD